MFSNKNVQWRKNKMEGHNSAMLVKERSIFAMIQKLAPTKGHT